MKTTPSLPLKAIIIAGACAGALLILVPSAIPQGSLTPPAGPPGQTMKSLDQIEPRRDVLKLPGDATHQFIISEPGSYFLSANLTGVYGKTGISIRASEVTLDLHGFLLTGVTGASDGIASTPGTSNIRIQNGKCVNWPGGGAYLALSEGSHVHQIESSGNGSGVYAGDDSVISDTVTRGNVNDGIHCFLRNALINCVANGNQIGIVMNDDSQAEGCQASANSGPGFLYTRRCTFSGCKANGNGGTGFSAGSNAEGDILVNCSASGNTLYGIAVFRHSTVTGCRATGNHGGFFSYQNGNSFIHCAASENSGTSPNNFGFSSGTGSQLQDCTAGNNTGNGIVAGQGSSITGCEVRGNTLDGILVPNDSR